MTDKEILRQYFSIADYIAAINGKKCEVLVHDLSSLKNSIVHIVNGEITGRAVGGSITNFGLDILKKKQAMTEDFVVNYLGTTEKKILRSSTYYIRNAKAEIIGLLCVNVDITELLNAQKTINQLVMLDVQANQQTTSEKFDLKMDDMVDQIIQTVILESGIELTGSTQEQKRELVKQVYDRGIFKFKGAIHQMAQMLRVSKQSVYRYIKDIEKGGG